jgi:flagellar hook-associated protein 1 FlgK
MGGLFGVLDTASRGLLITQGGIGVTGHNIANANNPAFSRQRQVLQAERPLVMPDGAIGLGVRQVAIERITDNFLARAIVDERSARGAIQVQSDALSQLEEVFNEQQGIGLTSVLADFYNAFEELAAATDPTGATERSLVLSRADALVGEFHRMDAQIRDQQVASDRAIRGVLDEINALSQRILELNDQIVAAEVTAPANDLRDLREEAVRDLAGLVDIQTFEQDRGNLVVMMKGNGLPLVEGTAARQLIGQASGTNPFDPTFVDVFYSDGANLVDITAEVGGGELGGLLAVRDQILPGAIRSLDTLAYNLIATVNAEHQTGFDLAGAAGADFFTDTLAAGVADAARTIGLDAALIADTIAAAGNPAGDPGDRENALDLAGLRSAAAALYLPGDPAPPGPATGPARSVLEHTAATIADVGQQAQIWNHARGEHERILETLENRRDAISGVSVDEEVVNLVRLQAAFQANARVIATVQQMLDELVSLL